MCTSMPEPASSSAAVMPAMPPPTTSTERCRNVRERGRSDWCWARSMAARTILRAFSWASAGSSLWMNEQPSRMLAKATAFSPRRSSRAMRSKVGPWKRGEHEAITR